MLVGVAWCFLPSATLAERLKYVKDHTMHLITPVKKVAAYIKRWGIAWMESERATARPGRGRHGWKHVIPAADIAKLVADITARNSDDSDELPVLSDFSNCLIGQRIMHKYDIPARKLRELVVDADPDIMVVSRHIKPGLKPDQRKKRLAAAKNRKNDTMLQNPNRGFMLDEASFTISELLNTNHKFLVKKGTAAATGAVSDNRLRSQPGFDTKRYKFLAVINPLLGAMRVVWTTGTVGYNSRYKVCMCVTCTMSSSMCHALHAWLDATHAATCICQLAAGALCT